MPRTEDSSSQPVSKKAYEICYAIFRVASEVKHPAFVEHLEGQGLDLLESAINSDYGAASVAAKAAEYLLRIGADVNFVNQSNAEVIAYELRQFNSAIAELENSAKTATMVNLDGAFSKLPVPVENHTPTEPIIGEKRGEEITQNQKSEPPREYGNGENNNNGNGVVKTAIRKSAILEIIRQSGSCHLKEIQNALPSVSERTVRYDIQNLIGQGLVERVGNGGPATYYKNRV